MDLKISEKFSDTPGPRYKHEGEFSGEIFRDTILKPAFLEAEKSDEKVLIDLDGTEGYATSFLEESFGGLARQFGSDRVEKRFIFVSEEEPYLIDEIILYIREAQ